MLTKDYLRSEFSKNWKEHYLVEIFKQKGFIRKTCPKCKKNFWTLDEKRVTCADPPCQNYDFINNTITKGKWDYIETWKMFEKFFTKNSHTSIPRYPVVDRWRPDLYFTIASIQDFQRIENGNMAFEYPANPLIVPQMCLRFNDIPNVGVTGRHLTSFIMAGQHAFGYPKEGYFKDRCIELNFEFLTKVMGIPEKELVYIEDVWAMPDFSAFGPCIETFSRGLELVNSVFMQFQKNGNGNQYRPLDLKVVDVGWGHERLVWFSNGTPAAYDSIFGPVSGKMKKISGIKVDPALFAKYSRIAGTLNLDEVADINKAMEDAAKYVGVSVKEMKESFEPLQNLYAVCDHSRTLLFALADGGIPSNVGGGYNLRVILRRALDFIDKNKFGFTIMDIASWHAEYLKPMFPELKGSIESMRKIIESEEKKYRNTLSSASKIVESRLEKESKFDDATLIKLYESHGITPELIESIAKSKGKATTISGEFYAKMAQMHEKEQPKGQQKKRVDVEGIKPTELLYYSEPEKGEFDAAVVKILGNRWLVLDKTLFYPTGGGQPYDTGTINGKKVISVEKISNVIIHEVEGIENFRESLKVHGIIDKERRRVLAQMHSGTHILGASARIVLGPHIWQGGANKGVNKSRLDVTHYEKISSEESKKIEDTANRIIKEAVPIDAKFMPRNEAEKKYGFRLYQGGAPPGNTIRVVTVGNYDAEACGGIHCRNSKDVMAIKILGTKKIQDGIVRIEFTAGDAIKESAGEFKNALALFAAELGVTDPKLVPSATKNLFDKWKSVDKAGKLVSYAKYIEKTDKNKALQIMENAKSMISKAKNDYDSRKPEKSVFATDDEIIEAVCKIINVKPDVFLNTIRRFRKETEDIESLAK